MVTSSPLISAQAVCATSGCQRRSLLGFKVSHHEATTANALKTIPSFSSFAANKYDAKQERDYEDDGCEQARRWKIKIERADGPYRTKEGSEPCECGGEKSQRFNCCQGSM